jgi:hypothetical protein
MEPDIAPCTLGGALLKLLCRCYHVDDFAYKILGQGWKGKGADIERVRLRLDRGRG